MTRWGGGAGCLDGGTGSFFEIQTPSPGPGGVESVGRRVVGRESSVGGSGGSKRAKIFSLFGSGSA